MFARAGTRLLLEPIFFIFSFLHHQTLHSGARSQLQPDAVVLLQCSLGVTTGQIN